MLNIRNLIVGVFASLLAVLPTASANAATIATFSFSQPGWPGGYTLTGAFTGTVDGSGFITKDGLTEFSATISGLLPTVYTLNALLVSPASLFSFNTSTPIDSGSLAIYVPFDSVFSLCVGAPAAFGLCGVQQAGLNPFGVLGPYYSAQAPTVTLVSIVTPGDPQAPTGIPEPATWAMMILGFGLLGRVFRSLGKTTAKHV